MNAKPVGYVEYNKRELNYICQEYFRRLRIRKIHRYKLAIKMHLKNDWKGMWWNKRKLTRHEAALELRESGGDYWTEYQYIHRLAEDFNSKVAAMGMACLSGNCPTVLVDVEFLAELNQAWKVK